MEKVSVIDKGQGVSPEKVAHLFKLADLTRKFC